MYLERLTANEYYRPPAEPGSSSSASSLFCTETLLPRVPLGTSVGHRVRCGFASETHQHAKPLVTASRACTFALPASRLIFDCCCVPVCKMKMTLCGLFSL